MLRQRDKYFFFGQTMFLQLLNHAQDILVRVAFELNSSLACFIKDLRSCFTGYAKQAVTGAVVLFRWSASIKE
jgi:hypothetical protein